MSRNYRTLRYIVYLATTFFPGFAAAEQCMAIFPGGIQSHSPSGVIQMDYMSRVQGSGPTLVASTVTHTHSWQDQVGLCDGVKCVASGTHAASSTPTFLTGSQVPPTFQSGNATGGDLVTGYQAPPLSRPAGNYGKVEVGQGAIISFTTVGGTYLMKGVKTNYQSTLELSAGDYWIDGDLDLQAEDSTLRRIGGGDGAVRLFVKGNVRAGQIQVQGYTAGQISIYATGNVNAGNDLKFPGFIHANGSVYLGTGAEVTGGVYSNNFSTNSSPIIRYTQINHDHKMGTLPPAYDSTFELAPGNYWIDGDLTAKVATKFRKLPGEGKVKLFVRGNIEIQHEVVFQNFGDGDLLLYATGDITISSQKDLPAFVYAAGDVTINFSNNGRYRGGITGRNIYIGQGSIIEYVKPIGMAPLCDSDGVVGQIDHFEFITSAGAHTCSPHMVTLKACINAAPEVCELYPGNVAVSLSSGGWIGGGNKSLVNGIGVFQLQGLQLQMPLALSSSAPVSTSQTLCRIGNAPLSPACMLSFSQSGFIFDVPGMVANRGAQKIPISAVIDKGAPGSPRCEPAFTDENVPRSIKFWSEFIAPPENELSSSSERVWVNNKAMAQSFAAAEPLPLYFNADGISYIDVNYREAGAMRLNAHYSGSTVENDSGLMVGSDDFVSTPSGFCITPEASCPSGDSDCPAFRQVGKSFTATIRPVAWNSGADICAGTTTRNYRQSKLKLEPVLVAPAPEGDSGEVLEPAAHSYDHVPPGAAAGWDGEIIQHVAFSEVGVFRLQVAPPSDAYYGETVPSSASEPIGRFYPTHLKVEGAGKLTAGCGAFSYQEQPIDISSPLALTITGYGRRPNGDEYVTNNYDFDGFWGFEDDRPAETWQAAERDLDLSARLLLDGAVTESGKNNRDGKRTYTWNAKQLSYTRSAAPSADDLLFSIRQRFSKEELTDRKDGDVCYDLGAGCQSFEQTIENSEIRLGRVRSGNIIVASGAEGDMPLRLEHWNGSAWIAAVDECTNAVSEAIVYPDKAKAGGLAKAGIENQWMDGVSKQSVKVTGEAPVPLWGSVQVKSLLTLNDTTTPATWLCQAGALMIGGVCTFEGGEARADAIVTFGTYQGPKPLIFRRELYRGM